MRATQRRTAGASRAALPRAGRLAIVTTIGLLAVLGTAAPALALPADGNGNYTQILCANPSSEEGLGISGMPEGLTNPASIDTWQVTTTEVNCADGRITPTRGVPMAVGQTNTYPQGTWSALLYQAPANVTINGGVIYRAEKAEGANGGFMGIIQQGGEYDVLYSLPRNSVDQGDWYVGNVASRGTFSEPFSAANLVNLTISPEGGHWDVNATCDPNGNNNSSCTLAQDQWEYRMFGGEISLNAVNDPQASNISGPLTTDSPLTGSEQITFSATDEGPGLAYVKMLVDGNVVQSEIMDSNDGRCVPIAGSNPYTWAYQVPCKTSLGGRTYSLNTTRLPNGEHHIQVLIEDAAGNQSIVLDRTVDIENTTAASRTSGATTGGEGGAFAAPAELGIPNGSGASESAELDLDGQRRIIRSFADRALTITGRLTTAAGTPIAAATLDLHEQIAGSSAQQLVGHAITASNGSFTVHAGPSASRMLVVSYRAYSSDIGYTAQASVQERVGARVQLHVTPEHTSSRGTILLSGRVSGPIPGQGVVVEILVRYRGTWEPLRTPRTNASGRFQVAYQFQGALGRFPFRAEVFAGQADFPYAHGESAIVDVSAK